MSWEEEDTRDWNDEGLYRDRDVDSYDEALELSLELMSLEAENPDMVREYVAGQQVTYLEGERRESALVAGQDGDRVLVELQGGEQWIAACRIEQRPLNVRQVLTDYDDRAVRRDRALRTGEYD